MFVRSAHQTQANSRVQRHLKLVLQLQDTSLAVGPVYSSTGNEAESQRSRALRSQDGQEHDLEVVILEVNENHASTNLGCGPLPGNGRSEFYLWGSDMVFRK